MSGRAQETPPDRPVGERCKHAACKQQLKEDTCGEGETMLHGLLLYRTITTLYFRKSPAGDSTESDDPHRGGCHGRGRRGGRCGPQDGPGQGATEEAVSGDGAPEGKGGRAEDRCECQFGAFHALTVHPSVCYTRHKRDRPALGRLQCLLLLQPGSIHGGICKLKVGSGRRSKCSSAMSSVCSSSWR